MKRYYYLSNSIDDTEKVHQNLIKKGFLLEHIKVYGVEDKIAQVKNFNPILSIFKSDIIHYIMRGFIIGFVLTILSSMVAAYFIEDVLSLLPFFILFGVMFTGFISWEAGLIGLHKTNYKLVPLIKFVNKSNHLVIFDIKDSQTKTLFDTLKYFKNIKAVAVGSNFVNPFEDQETILPRY
jgi:hypothetical protein